MSTEIIYHSGVYTLKSTQKLYGTPAEIWDFFSRPENLNKMVSDDLKFEITSKDLPSKTYHGQIITYTIEIFPKIKNYWITEITLLEGEKVFIYEQRFGPYKLWHHEHHFETISEDEILMTDIVTYKLRFGYLGRLICGFFIKKKLKKIFRFRYNYCEKTFCRRVR